MDFGNLDVTTTKQAVTLRMRHVVEGHPGCVLGFPEAKRLGQYLQTLEPTDDDAKLAVEGPQRFPDIEDLI